MSDPILFWTLFAVIAANIVILVSAFISADLEARRLEIETRVQDSLHKAKQEAPKISEKEEQTASMQRRQIEELELIYQYLSGPRFRRRIEAIVEKFSSMQTDLNRERKAMTRLRAKREEQIRGVIESTVGMYGDLQGITGTSLEEIDGLFRLLDGSKHDGSAASHPVR